MKTEVICLEGITGAGKTTQANMLSNYLSSSNKKYLIVNEKTYEPFKQSILDWHNEGANQNFNEETIGKIAKARGETHKKHFLPLIEKINYLIFDRSLYTSGVYQKGNLGIEKIIEINLQKGAIKPDRGLVFICSPKIAKLRTDKRRIKNNHYKFPSIHENLKEITKRRELYIQLVKHHPELQLIDTTNKTYN